ncbi:phage protease [Oleidesulfovibrio alaskensis]|jgi:phage I-like protein|uniref:phage protease n=1 Tax=Oleidesulfovibrio alaskensis TaxID=58180 RepID=UPI00040645B5|nr:phage protease [Oleidesulfovibrio alaskensis]
MTHLSTRHTAYPAASLAVPLSQGGAGHSDLPEMLSQKELPAGCNIQLFPEGRFAARDGRPATITEGRLTHWQMDASIAEAIIAAAEARETPIVIDYEHQSLNARANGQPAPASGWLQRLVYVAGKGLFASVSWTDKARGYIDAGEYKYISPYFSFDPETGAVLALINAALTNTPALDGLDAVALALGNVHAASAHVQAAQTTEQETTMDELLERLRWMLNLPVTATAADITAQLDKLKDMLGASDAAAASDQPGGTPVSLLDVLQHKDSQIAALTQQAATPDPARFAPVAALTALQQANAALKNRVAELETSSIENALNAEIDAALSDGRLNKAVEGWARGLAKDAPDTLRTFLSSAVPVAALGAMQTGGVPPAGTQDSSAALTAEEDYVINQLGITPEEYHAAKSGKGN